MAGTKIRYSSGVPDGATAIAHELDTKTSLVNTGAKLWSIKNATTEKFSLDKDGYRFGEGALSRVYIVYPSQGRAGIQAALDAAKIAGGGTVQLLAGTYVIDAPGIYIFDLENVTLQGVGDATILEHNNDVSQFTTLVWHATAYGTAGNSTTKGNTSVFTTVTGNNVNFAVGDRITIRGGVRTDDSSSDLDLEVNEVIGIGPTAGEIQLRDPLLYTMTSITLFRSRTAYNSWVKDLKFTFTGSNGLAAASIAGYYRSGFDNVTVIGGAQTGGYGVIGLNAAIGLNYPGLYCELKNCKVSGCDASGISIFHQIYATVKNCKFNNIGLVAGTFYTGAIVVERECNNTRVENNIVTNVRGGWAIRQSGTQRRRTAVIGNQIIYCHNGGINLDDCTNIENNYLEDVGLGGVTSSFGGAIAVSGSVYSRTIISANIVRKARLGVDCYTKPNFVITNNICTECTEAGLQIGPHSVISGNVAMTTGSSYCVYIGGIASFDGTSFIGNVIRTGTIGIYLGGTTFATIAHNLISNISSSALYLNATNNNILIGNHLRAQTIGYTGINTDNDLIGNKL